MDYSEVLRRAKEKLAPHCMVCKECNGIACRGKVPGVGAKGTGNSFIRNYQYLSSVKVEMDTIYEFKGQDTSTELFGHSFKAPIFAAPIGGMKFNYNDIISEIDYATAVVTGTVAAGCAAFTGDGADDTCYEAPLIPIKTVKGIAVPTLKPWKNDRVFEKMKMAEGIGVMAFAMDIDSAGLVHLAKSGTPVFSKTIDELKEIVRYCKVPFIIKGIMSAKAAEKAVESGAYGIVVSNHGGRVLDNTPATCEVLPEIRQAVGDRVKVFVDGGIRTGADVFKALALGADAALIGRPYAVMAVGNGADGVRLYTEKLIHELKETMIMTGCTTLEDITFDKVRMV
ncbi:MAG: alpha-hydroxy-acid oxidizing protein [Clostridia bacterium]|jgi:4-hydroxymandelate oxidase